MQFERVFVSHGTVRGRFVYTRDQMIALKPTAVHRPIDIWGRSGGGHTEVAEEERSGEGRERAPDNRDLGEGGLSRVSPLSLWAT